MKIIRISKNYQNLMILNRIRYNKMHTINALKHNKKEQLDSINRA